MLNPVFRRETKTSLRNWKVFYAISGYIFLVSLVAAVAIWQIMYNSYAASFNPSEMTTVYIGLTILELALVLLITPSLTAGSISGERERQTLDLLLITKVSPFSIILGKFLSGLSIIVNDICNNAYICNDNVLWRNKHIICACRYGIYDTCLRGIWCHCYVFLYSV